jgi:hypothetical protein
VALTSITNVTYFSGSSTVGKGSTVLCMIASSQVFFPPTHNKGFPGPPSVSLLTVISLTFLSYPLMQVQDVWGEQDSPGPEHMPESQGPFFLVHGSQMGGVGKIHT